MSCGCKPNARSRKHGMVGTPEYEAWSQMKKRCTNPKHKYWHRYGGRGITVCERWQEFENFYSDMGDRPEGKQLDRLDNDKGYSPDNCRWVTSKENNNNRENSIKVDFGYFQLTIDELAELAMVNRVSIYNRWKRYGNAWDCLFPIDLRIKQSTRPLLLDQSRADCVVD